MDNRVFKEWLEEPRAIRALPDRKKRVLFVDNCSGHNENESIALACAAINTELRKLPANATDLVQPADSFLISKIKDAWRRVWDQYKLQMINEKRWMPEVEGSSGKLRNPGKYFFLELAALSVREVNSQRDSDGMSYARKAMIKCGMSLNTTDRWEECQLFEQLQDIIAEHRNHFEGAPVE